MKKLPILIIAAIIAVSFYGSVQAQTLEIQLNSATYANGYDITCHGAANGSIEAICVNGDEPYAYVWSNGATTKTINNLAAGTYTVTVYDWNNHWGVKDITLRGPDVLEALLIADECAGGTNICEQGASTGHIYSEIQGGSPPYTYLWNTGSQSQTIGDVPAGTYTLTVTDINNCTSSQHITLTEPTALHIVSISSPQHHGYNVSCNGGSDGAITLNLAGGVPPYSFQWNNGSMDQNPQDLVARVYMVRVYDQNGAMVIGQITLTQAPVINVALTPYAYSNGFNLSAFNSLDGSITTNVTGGAAPYSYTWQTLPQKTTANLTNASEGFYMLKVTDANGCDVYNSTNLTQPERDDWNMNGNWGTNPATQFIGTTDNKDLKFRTNNLERLTLNANGDIKMNGFVGGAGPLYIDDNGVIKSGFVTSAFAPCAGTVSPVWQSLNTNILFTCLPNKVGIGTYAPAERLHVIGNAIFSATSSGYSSCAYIRANNIASSNTTPEYTWYNDLQTGIFHPSLTNNVIAFTNGGTESMRIVKDAAGNIIVGIGINPLNLNPAPTTPYKLMVEGKIGARDIVVQNPALAWPDYVFNKDYKLQPLTEIENFITKNHHLPDVPKANEITTNGQELGTLQVVQQQKIEDIYLYLIALEKRVKELEKENLLLKK